MTESLNMHKHLSNNLLFYWYWYTGRKTNWHSVPFQNQIQSTNVAQICGWCHHKVKKNEIYYSTYNRFRPEYDLFSEVQDFCGGLEPSQLLNLLPVAL